MGRRQILGEVAMIAAQASGLIARGGKVPADLLRNPYAIEKRWKPPRALDPVENDLALRGFLMAIKNSYR